MNTKKEFVAYVVVYGGVRVVNVAKETETGIRGVCGTFYQNGKVYSGHRKANKGYFTQLVTYSRVEAKKLAEAQRKEQIEYLQGRIVEANSKPFFINGFGV